MDAVCTQWTSWHQITKDEQTYILCKLYQIMSPLVVKFLKAFVLELKLTKAKSSLELIGYIAWANLFTLEELGVLLVHGRSPPSILSHSLTEANTLL